jgi:hypothetical protein
MDGDAIKNHEWTQRGRAPTEATKEWEKILELLIVDYWRLEI